MTRQKSLRRRITLSFGLTTLLLSLALSIPFGWYVRASIHAELDALAREEVEETRVHFDEGAPSVEGFGALASDFRLQHPRNPLAWRIWSDGALWGEFDEHGLLRHAPSSPTGPEGLHAPSAALRVALAPLNAGMHVAMVLDGSWQTARFTRFLWLALGFSLIATAVATLAGRLVARRVSTLLARVAECARTEEAVESWPAPGEAPEEIQSVVRALQDTLRRIREESENMRVLIAGTAHELRSPLQNLIGETQVTLLREREAEEYRRVLESHVEELAELSRGVDNLVTLASIGEARRRPTVEHFDLAEEVRLRLGREKELAARRRVDLRLVADGPLPVAGDRESLLLALRNVVTNAIEWSPPGKPVEVDVRTRAQGVEIVVDDAGPGVAPSERENIFRPFHRSAAARGRRVGYGLGLALTHSAVDAQGGTIEVDESPLGGARFRIRIPARRDGRGPDQSEANEVALGAARR